jgi:hypothetical protein
MGGGRKLENQRSAVSLVRRGVLSELKSPLRDSPPKTIPGTVRTPLSRFSRFLVAGSIALGSLFTPNFSRAEDKKPVQVAKVTSSSVKSSTGIQNQNKAITCALNMPKVKEMKLEEIPYNEMYPSGGVQDGDRVPEGKVGTVYGGGKDYTELYTVWHIRLFNGEDTVLRVLLMTLKKDVDEEQKKGSIYLSITGNSSIVAEFEVGKVLAKANSAIGCGSLSNPYLVVERMADDQKYGKHYRIRVAAREDAPSAVLETDWYSGPNNITKEVIKYVSGNPVKTAMK